MSCRGGRVFSRAHWPDLSLSITMTVIKLLEHFRFTLNFRFILKNSVNLVHTKDVV
jgi:hypothetical protein